MSNKLKAILSLLLIIGVALGAIYGFEVYKKHKVVVDAKNEINIIDAEIEKYEDMLAENKRITTENNKKDTVTNPVLKQYFTGYDEFENENKTIENLIKKKRTEKLDLLQKIKDNS